MSPSNKHNPPASNTSDEEGPFYACQFSQALIYDVMGNLVVDPRTCQAPAYLGERSYPQSGIPCKSVRNPQTPTMNGTHAARSVIRHKTGTMPALNASPNV